MPHLPAPGGGGPAMYAAAQRGAVVGNAGMLRRASAGAQQHTQPTPRQQRSAWAPYRERAGNQARHGQHHKLARCGACHLGVCLRRCSTEAFRNLVSVYELRISNKVQDCNCVWGCGTALPALETLLCAERRLAPSHYTHTRPASARATHRTLAHTAIRFGTRKRLHVPRTPWNPLGAVQQHRP